MKYRLIALLLLGALLAGCVPQNTLPSTSAPSCAPTAPSTVPTVPTDPTETLPEMIPATLLDQAEAVEDFCRLFDGAERPLLVAYNAQFDLNFLYFFRYFP